MCQKENCVSVVDNNNGTQYYTTDFHLQPELTWTTHTQANRHRRWAVVNIVLYLNKIFFILVEVKHLII